MLIREQPWILLKFKPFNQPVVFMSRENNLEVTSEKDVHLKV